MKEASIKKITVDCDNCTFVIVGDLCTLITWYGESVTVTVEQMIESLRAIRCQESSS